MLSTTITSRKAIQMTLKDNKMAMTIIRKKTSNPIDWKAWKKKNRKNPWLKKVRRSSTTNSYSRTLRNNPIKKE